MKNALIVILVLTVFSSKAQNFKFGKVSEEEVLQSVNPLDSSANATVLYKNENIGFVFQKDEGFMQVRTVHERIKIYTKEGFDWATKRIRLYDESNAKSESLQSIKAYTYNYIDGKVEKDKLRKDGIFSEETNKYWKIKSFTMPNIKVGCVIEYTYDIKSPFLAIDDVEFQYTIPINEFDLKIVTPEYFVYNRLFNPRAIYVPQLDFSRNNRTLTISSKQRSGKVVSQSTFSNSKLTFQEDIITSHEQHIPAIENEPYVGYLDNYRSKLSLELTSIRYPNEPYKSLATDWETVTKNIYNNPDFGNQLNKSNYYETELDLLLADVTDLEQKIAIIFNHVKTKVKWNDYYGYTTEVGVKKAYKDGSGNVADINLMLVAMLRYAGVEANPVLISTKNNGIPLFPTRNGFNSVICLVENEDLNMMLDATDLYSSFNTLPNRDLNWQGRVIREGGSSTWVDLQPNFVSNETSMVQVVITPELTAEGKVRCRKQDYVAKGYREKHGIANTENFRKSLEKDKGGLVVSEMNIKNAENIASPVDITYAYSYAEGINEIGTNLYFSPMLFLADEENPFKSNSRRLPIDLNYPFSDTYKINIQLPEGYEVETIPEDVRLDFNQGTGYYSYIISQNENFIQLIIDLDLKTSLILADDYPAFKEFYSVVIEKQSEQIVLKKV